jgi:hypothetical protein
MFAQFGTFQGEIVGVFTPFETVLLIIKNKGVQPDDFE